MIMGKYVGWDKESSFYHLVLQDSIPEKPFIMKHKGADLKTGYHLYEMVLDGNTISVDNMEPHVGQLQGFYNKVAVARKARYGGDTVVVLESHPGSNPDNAHIQFIKAD